MVGTMFCITSCRGFGMRQALEKIARLKEGLGIFSSELEFCMTLANNKYYKTVSRHWFGD